MSNRAELDAIMGRLSEATTHLILDEAQRRDTILREELLHGTKRVVEIAEAWGGSTQYLLPRTRFARRRLYRRILKKARKS